MKTKQSDQRSAAKSRVEVDSDSPSEVDTQFNREIPDSSEENRTEENQISREEQDSEYE